MREDVSGAGARLHGKPVPVDAAAAETADFGTRLRSWRKRRGISQLELASMAGVSQRHISFLETGRSRPSREMVSHLARVLRLSPRDENLLLLSAGFAPRYSERPPTELGEISHALEFLLDAHEPNMAVLVDRHWNLIAANRSALDFTGAAVDEPPLWRGKMNVMYLMLHPDGLRPYMTNFEDVAINLLRRFEWEVAMSPDDLTLRELYAALVELTPSVRSAYTSGSLVETVNFRIGGVEIRMFSCITKVESAIDITVDGIRLETFFAADAASAEGLSRLLRSRR